MFTFPFGRSLEARPPLANAGGLFILGAYPSALHVRWKPPAGKGIAALAVDNEPEPFWDGADEREQIDRWKRIASFVDEYGTVSGAQSLNGSSGAWVRDRVLARFGVNRESTWISDCLDTYRGSDAQAAALHDRFNPFAAKRGLTIASLPPHPSEDEIVTEALESQRARIRAELDAAQPTSIVTLGNAAMRVVRELAKWERDPGRAIAKSPSQYGHAVEVQLGNHTCVWYPVCHPASPRRYQELHDEWAP